MYENEKLFYSHLFFYSCSGRLKIADLGLSRIFLKEDELKGRSESEDGENAQSDEDVKRRIRQRQYSHQVATRWYR